MRGLILAGLRSGRLPEVLEEYVDLEHSQADLHRRLWSSLLYPFVLLAFLTAMAVFARVYIIGGFREHFQDFGMMLPTMTVWFIRFLVADDVGHGGSVVPADVGADLAGGGAACRVGYGRCCTKYR